eukprot:XP_001705816.1 Hypothetical protein GL50803_36412 [Giardia lamblia ATCC 50803]
MINQADVKAHVGTYRSTILCYHFTTCRYRKSKQWLNLFCRHNRPQLKGYLSAKNIDSVQKKA